MTTPKNRYDILFPEAKLGNVLLGGKLLKSPLGRYPCDVCHQHTEWFRRDLNARICSEQCADKVIGERPDLQEATADVAKQVAAAVMEDAAPPKPKPFPRIDNEAIIAKIADFHNDDGNTKELLAHIAAEMQARKEPA